MPFVPRHPLAAYEREVAKLKQRELEAEGRFAEAHPTPQLPPLLLPRREDMTRVHGAHAATVLLRALPADTTPERLRELLKEANVQGEVVVDMQQHRQQQQGQTPHAGGDLVRFHSLAEADAFTRYVDTVLPRSLGISVQDAGAKRVPTVRLHQVAPSVMEGDIREALGPDLAPMIVRLPSAARLQLIFVDASEAMAFAQHVRSFEPEQLPNQDTASESNSRSIGNSENRMQASVFTAHEAHAANTAEGSAPLEALHLVEVTNLPPGVVSADNLFETLGGEYSSWMVGEDHPILSAQFVSAPQTEALVTMTSEHAVQEAIGRVKFAEVDGKPMEAGLWFAKAPAVRLRGLPQGASVDEIHQLLSAHGFTPADLSVDHDKSRIRARPKNSALVFFDWESEAKNCAEALNGQPVTGPSGKTTHVSAKATAEPLHALRIKNVPVLAPLDYLSEQFVGFQPARVTVEPGLLPHLQNLTVSFYDARDPDFAMRILADRDVFSLGNIMAFLERHTPADDRMSLVQTHTRAAIAEMEARLSRSTALAQAAADEAQSMAAVNGGVAAAVADAAQKVASGTNVGTEGGDPSVVAARMERHSTSEDDLATLGTFMNAMTERELGEDALRRHKALASLPGASDEFADGTPVTVVKGIPFEYAHGVDTLVLRDLRKKFLASSSTAAPVEAAEVQEILDAHAPGDRGEALSPVESQALATLVEEAESEGRSVEGATMDFLPTVKFFDDGRAYKPCLRVRGLPFEETPHQLRARLEARGVPANSILDVTMRHHGTAEIGFHTTKTAQQAAEKLRAHKAEADAHAANGRPPLGVVDKVCNALRVPTVRVFGLPPSLSAADFVRPFQPFVDVANVTRQAQLHFASEEEATAAIEALNNLPAPDGGSGRINARLQQLNALALADPAYDTPGHFEAEEESMMRAVHNNEFLPSLQARLMVLRNEFERAWSLFMRAEDPKAFTDGKVDLRDISNYVHIPVALRYSYMRTLATLADPRNEDEISQEVMQIAPRGVPVNMIPPQLLSAQMCFRVFLSRTDKRRWAEDLQDLGDKIGQSVYYADFWKGIDWQHFMTTEPDELIGHARFRKRQRSWRRQETELRDMHKIPFGVQLPDGLAEVSLTWPHFQGYHDERVNYNEYTAAKEDRMHAKLQEFFPPMDYTTAMAEASLTNKDLGEIPQSIAQYLMDHPLYLGTVMQGGLTVEPGEVTAQLLGGEENVRANPHYAAEVEVAVTAAMEELSFGRWLEKGLEGAYQDRVVEQKHRQRQLFGTTFDEIEMFKGKAKEEEVAKKVAEDSRMYVEAQRERMMRKMDKTLVATLMNKYPDLTERIKDPDFDFEGLKEVREQFHDAADAFEPEPSMSGAQGALEREMDHILLDYQGLLNSMGGNRPFQEMKSRVERKIRHLRGVVHREPIDEEEQDEDLAFLNRLLREAGENDDQASGKSQGQSAEPAQASAGAGAGAGAAETEGRRPRHRPAAHDFKRFSSQAEEQEWRDRQQRLLQLADMHAASSDTLGVEGSQRFAGIGETFDRARALMDVAMGAPPIYAAAAQNRFQPVLEELENAVRLPGSEAAAASKATAADRADAKLPRLHREMITRVREYIKSRTALMDSTFDDVDRLRKRYEALSETEKAAFRREWNAFNRARAATGADAGADKDGAHEVPLSNTTAVTSSAELDGLQVFSRDELAAMMPTDPMDTLRSQTGSRLLETVAHKALARYMARHSRPHLSEIDAVHSKPVASGNTAGEGPDLQRWRQIDKEGIQAMTDAERQRTAEMLGTVTPLESGEASVYSALGDIAGSLAQETQHDFEEELVAALLNRLCEEHGVGLAVDEAAQHLRSIVDAWVDRSEEDGGSNDVAATLRRGGANVMANDTDEVVSGDDAGLDHPLPWDAYRSVELDLPAEIANETDPAARSRKLDALRRTQFFEHQMREANALMHFLRRSGASRATPQSDTFKQDLGMRGDAFTSKAQLLQNQADDPLMAALHQEKEDSLVDPHVPRWGGEEPGSDDELDGPLVNENPDAAYRAKFAPERRYPADLSHIAEAAAEQPFEDAEVDVTKTPLSHSRLAQPVTEEEARYSKGGVSADFFAPPGEDGEDWLRAMFTDGDDEDDDEIDNDDRSGGAADQRMTLLQSASGRRGSKADDSDLFGESEKSGRYDRNAHGDGDGDEDSDHDDWEVIFGDARGSFDAEASDENSAAAVGDELDASWLSDSDQEFGGLSEDQWLELESEALAGSRESHPIPGVAGTAPVPAAGDADEDDIEALNDENSFRQAGDTGTARDAHIRGRPRANPEDNDSIAARYHRYVGTRKSSPHLAVRDQDGTRWSVQIVETGIVQKVVKGGYNVTNRALVVVGDGVSRGGFAYGRGPTMEAATAKAVRNAMKNVYHLDAYQGSALAHNLYGKHNNCYCKIVATPPERGLVGSELAQSILLGFGITSASVKFGGRRTPVNQVRAIFHALSKHRDLEKMARARGLKYVDLYHQRRYGFGTHNYHES